MAALTEFTLDSTDGKSRLHVLKWTPEAGSAKAVLQIAHGIVEHIGRYDDFARFMADNGFLVVGNSHLGHGRSAANEQDKGFFTEKRGWNTAVNDMYKLYETTRAEHPDLPYFLLGHSMGSFLTRTLLIDCREALTGCIISGTGQQSRALLELGLAVSSLTKLFFGPRTKSKRLQKLGFGANNKRITERRTPYDWLSRDPVNVDKYIDDDDSGYVPTAGLFYDMLWGIRYIGNRKNIAKMRKELPILMVSGTEDPVGEYCKGVNKVYGLFRDAGINDVTLKFYDGARHEILNETNRQEVYADVLAWTNSKIQTPGQ
jgi:alpha-beta hydrolase superfamily lysophospholipase